MNTTTSGPSNARARDALSLVTAENPLGFNGVAWEKLPAVLVFPLMGQNSISVLRVLKNIKGVLNAFSGYENEDDDSMQVALDDLDLLIGAVK